MTQALIYIDVSEIREGKLDQLMKALNELVEFVKENESLPFAYSFYFNPDKTLLTLIQIHPNSSSLEEHLRIAGSRFPRFSDFIKLKRIEIYGIASEEVLKQLNNKAQMLGGAIVQTHQLHAGFIRQRSS